MTPPIFTATLLALTIVAERIGSALSTDDTQLALEQALVLEHGANLLTVALAKHRDVSPEQLQKLRDDLATNIHDRPHNESSVSDAAVANFLNQRLNADNN